MSSPVPIAIELVLEAVVEVCVEEITAARREVAMVRAATTAERHYLEQRIAELTGERDEARHEGQVAAETVLALRKRIVELERETTKPSKVSTTLQDRQPVRESVHQAEKTPERAPSLPLSPPRVAVEKGATFSPRNLPPEDLTGERLGSYVCEGKSGERRADGRLIWNFRCEKCGVRKQYSQNDLRRLRKYNPNTTCRCNGATPKPASSDRTGVVLGSFTCTGDAGRDNLGKQRWAFTCGGCKGQLCLRSDVVRRHLNDGTTPRCHTCEPKDRRGRKPGQALRGPRGHGRPSHDRPEAYVTRDAIDERLDELDTSIGGDDLDGLMSRAMAEADGDGRIRALAARAGLRPTRPSDLEDDERDDEDEDQQIAVESGDDEDEDGDGAEELDFG